eukprot:1592162-Amphidinium_carterae.2
MTEKQGEVEMTDLVDYYDSTGLSPQKVAESTGDERKKWREAATKDVKNLTNSGTVTFLTPAEQLTPKEKKFFQLVKVPGTGYTHTAVNTFSN